MRIERALYCSPSLSDAMQMVTCNGFRGQTRQTCAWIWSTATFTFVLRTGPSFISMRLASKKQRKGMGSDIGTSRFVRQRTKNKNDQHRHLAARTGSPTLIYPEDRAHDSLSLCVHTHDTVFAQPHHALSSGQGHVRRARPK